MEIREAVTVRVPADQAWALVGGAFGDIGMWATTVVTSTLDTPAAPSSVRTCHIRGFGPVAPGVIKERLTRFDPADQSLAFEWIEGRPSFIVHAASRWSVHSTEADSCTIRVRATVVLHPIMRPLGAPVRWWIRRAGGKVLDELAYRLETGTPHPRKLAAVLF